MTVPVDIVGALPIWAGRPRIEPLLGGLSNLSFCVNDGAGKYVARLTRDFPFHHVVRTREVSISRAAHAAGFAPELVYAAPGVMVTRFIEGMVLGAADIVPNLTRIAPLLRRFHDDMPRFTAPGEPLWSVFDVNRDYLIQLAGTETLSAAEIARWSALNADCEAIQGHRSAGFCHHDLLAANFIDDGKKLWLIDYEYAAPGLPLFDLANLSSNAALAPAQSEALLDAYFKAPPDGPLSRAHKTLEVASLLREALWSLVSAQHLSVPGADYRGYARENFQRLELVLARWSIFCSD